MEEEDKPNLRQYIPQKFSKMYLLRVIFYVVTLGSVCYLVYFQLKKEPPERPEVREIRGVQIEK